MAIILTILFVILRVANVITWPLVWVFAPLWIEAATAVIVLIVCFIITLLT